MNSALYAGVVTHVRRRPRRLALRYRVLQGLFDLDELPTLDRRLRLFGHNRPAPISFHDRDHGDGSGGLRIWVEGELAKAGLQGPWGAIRVLCMPRMLGYVFNPLSVYFCHDAADRLAAIVYEVNNTFGDRHAYALPVDCSGAMVRQDCEKAFYVSPFLPMDLRYEFRVGPPSRTVAVDITARDAEGPMLEALFLGHAQALSDRTLLGALLAYPAMTFKVVVGIHWEALKLLFAGVRLIPRQA